MPEMTREQRLETELTVLIAFVGVMYGRGPDAIIPETAMTPLGVPVKIGEMIHAAQAVLHERPHA